ncbi:MAG: Holliday junction branch migration protein RuvA [Acidimicrobiales bacterium]
MIGWLEGEVHHRLPSGAVVLDVRGVGYEVHVAREEFATGDRARLFVYTVVRDDAILLYGFATLEERELFEMLLATPGVGPSTALGALRTMTTGELVAAIESGDAQRVALIPGIGPKTASRIVLELKGKVVALPGEQNGRVSDQEGVEDALRALGYTSAEIRDVLRDAPPAEDESAALREALHRLRPR